MAVQVTNINELKNSEITITNAKVSYDEALKKLSDAIKITEFSWQGEDGMKFREDLMALINNDLKDVSEEMNSEINYLKKIHTILENAQEQVKNRLNS